MSINKFISPGFLLSLDLFIVSFVNWIYWLFISKLTSTAEVGQATSVYSFTVLTSAVTLLGLEYSLVKKSSSERSNILGTAFIIVSLVTILSIPILYYSINNLYNGSLSGLVWVAVGIVIFSSQRYILRYALLGLLDAKSVLVINITGALIQLVIGVVLVSAGLGALGILSSFFFNVLFITVLSLLKARKSFKLRAGDLKYCKSILKDALVNMPTPVAKIVIYSLSVVLLASFGTSQSDVGVFYIALMLSVIMVGFAANIALMVIPASSASRKDLSEDSFRIGLSLTAPLITILIVAPRSILSLVGPEYTSADIALLIMSAGMFPYTIVVNAISRFNNTDSPREIVTIGSILVSVFLLSFVFLVPLYGIVGAALSILLASIASALPAIHWLRNASLTRYATTSLLSILAGVVVGYCLKLAFDFMHPVFYLLICVTIVMIINFRLKNTSLEELRLIAKGIAAK
jgi:O-antigen/teichoic acid export membrane protein